MRKQVSLLLSLFLVFSVLPVKVNAENKTEEKMDVVQVEKENAKAGEIGAGALMEIEPETGEEAEVLNGVYEDLIYEISNGEVTITDCDESATSVDIPAKIEGYPVTSIGSFAFEYCYSLESVSISNSVKSIGNGAFYLCESLTSITIPNSVTSIEDSTFKDCTSLRSINIPNSVKSIGIHAFSWCYSLTSVTIPDSVTSIGDNAFEYCLSFTNIEIPSSLTSIGSGLFFGCSNLKSITIPSSVKSIGFSAFIYCSNLTSVTIPNSVTSIEGFAFAGCTNLTSVTIPDSVTSIDVGLFEDCSCLETVKIGNDVTSIGREAFSGCSSLKSIALPDSVTSIGEKAFYGCSSLKTAGPIGGGYNIELGWETEIPDHIFYHNCDSLTSIRIPDNITSIGTEAFSGCESLTTVELGDGLKSIGSSAFAYCSNINLIAFSDSGDSATHIESYAFYACTGIVEVAIGNNVTMIDDSAFMDCTSLKSVVIPYSVFRIGIQAFADCPSLTNIKISGNTTSIGFGAFSGCNNLVTAGPLGGGYDYEFGWTTEIPAYAFSMCESLSSIVMPNSITSIGYNAFYECSNLSSITIPKSVTTIDYETFSGCSSLKTAGPVGGGYNYEFEWTTEIPDYAFSNCSALTRVTIPKSVKSIGASAFAGCNNLITAGPLGGGYDYEFGWTTEIPDNAFSYCKNLTRIVIPDSVTSIGKYAFEDCDSITNFTIPDCVTSIGKEAFAYCDNLKKVYFKGDYQSSFSTNIFTSSMMLNCYYPENNQTWTSDHRHRYGADSVTWIPWDPNTGEEGGTTEDSKAYAVFQNNTELVFFRSDEDYKNGSIGTFKDVRGNTYTGTLFADFEDRLVESADDVPWLEACSSAKIVYVAEGQRIHPKSMDYWFRDFSSLESFDDTGFDTSDVTSMRALFWLAGNLDTSLSLTHFNTAKVVDMSQMFFGSHFSKLDISSFDTSSIVNMLDMFSDTTRLETVILGKKMTKWHVSGSLGDDGDYWRHVFDNGLMITINAMELCREYPNNISSWSGAWTRYTEVPINPPVVQTSTDENEYKFYYWSEFRDKEMAYTYDYDEKWFFEDTTEYNHELALMSLKMAMASMADDETQVDNRHILDLYHSLEFKNHMVRSSYPIPEDNSIGYTIGAKNIEYNDKIITLIAVTVRSGGYGQEWAGNFEVGKGTNHSGFDKASEIVLTGLKDYIKKNSDFLQDDIKVWVTGFSRGAATCNIISAKLDDGVIPGITKEDVYSYSFECPKNTKAELAEESKYNNLYYVNNPIDMVTKIAPSKWDFTTYGREILYQSASNEKQDDYYGTYRQGMIAKYIDILNYNHLDNADRIARLSSHEKLGQSELLDLLVTIIATIPKNSDEFASLYQEAVKGVVRKSLGNGDFGYDMDFFCDLLDALGKKTLVGELEKISKGIIGPIDEIYSFLKKIVISAGLGIGFADGLYLFIDQDFEKVEGHKWPVVLKAHYPEYSLAWMEAWKANPEWHPKQTIHPGEVSIQSVKKSKGFDANFSYGPLTNRHLSIDASANITIYNADGSLLARVIDGEAEEIEYGLFSYIGLNNQRIFVIPNAYECIVEIEPTENGTLSYTCTEQRVSSDKPEKVVSYIEIEADTGDHFIGTIESITEDENAGVYELEKDGQSIEPDVQLEGNSIAHYMVEITVEGDGTAVGEGEYAISEYAWLHVTDGQDYFNGWYDQNDNLLTDSISYSFLVKDNTHIIAKFNEKPSKSIALNKAELDLRVGKTETLIATVIPEGTELTWSSSDPSVATVDQNGKVTAVADTGIGTPAQAEITASTADGTVSAKCIVTVEDPINGFVRRLYKLCFNRTADPGGFRQWTNGLRTKKNSAAATVRFFFTSQEFKNLKLNDDAFVEMCYQVMMDRASDAGGKKNWVSKLDIGMSQTYVLRGFIASREFSKICADYGITVGSISLTEPRDQNQGITEFVSRCYSEVLGRKADIGGLNDWCNRILTASSRKQAAIDAASTGFFHSAEYLNKHTSNDQYVRTLYRTFLGREADQGGYNDWMNRLRTGTSRDSVMKGFANSTEFANIMAKYGIK